MLVTPNDLLNESVELEIDVAPVSASQVGVGVFAALCRVHSCAAAV